MALPYKNAGEHGLRDMNGVVTVIPAYNEARTLRAVVVGVLRHCPQVIVIDDGSTDSTAASVADLPITLVRNPRNLGKAASLWAGMRAALRHGASAVITLDADGQHRPEDIPRFLAMAQAHPREIITGSRLAEKAAFPRKRYIANKIANFWISWAAGYAVDDSQCGFRLYPAGLLRRLDLRSEGFVLESEILIQGAQRGCLSLFLPIPALYAGNARPSHFRAVKDIALITRMVARSLLSRWLYLPGLYRGVIRPQAWHRKRMGANAVLSTRLLRDA